MKFINLTPHPITIVIGEKTLQIEASGRVARVAVENPPLRVIEYDGVKIAIVENRFGSIDNLPEPEAETVYIVSLLVIGAAGGSGRKDIVAPDSGATSIRFPAGHSQAGQIKAVTRLIGCS